MVVTRFAPSPTGYLHVGGLRTALYAYLFAQQNKGKIILRIEDTDQKREVEGAEENLIKTLTWAGIIFDEGPHQGGPHAPYQQSKRTDLYQFQAKELIKTGKAYYCFCTEERLEELRLKQEASKVATGYDGYCRNLTEEEIRVNLKQDIPHVIRLKVPRDELIMFEDLVRGKVKFLSHTIDDQVLLKSDGFPTYHLANVVDDHLMEVTHVIRGEEWLPSTPKHVLLYQAFGWNIPIFAHIPLILNPDRSKLSKRQGDVAVEDYMQKGYEKEELINFIAFLGWNPGGTKEIYSIEELIEAFDLKKVQKAGAIFNHEKLRWYRGVWRQRKLAQFARSKGLEGKFEETKQGGYKLSIRADKDRYLFAEKILEIVKQFLDPKAEKEGSLLLRALYTVRDKVIQEPEKVNEFIACYIDQLAFDRNLLLNEKMEVDQKVASQALQLSLKTFESITSWSEESIEISMKGAIQQAGLTNGQVLWPLRVALTHAQYSPGAFESAWVLGREKSLHLIREALC